MLDIKFIVSNTDEVIKRLNSRNKDYAQQINEVVSLYGEYKNLLIKVENSKSLLNEKSKMIGQYKRENKDVSTLLSEIETLKSESNDTEVKQKYNEINYILLRLPNLPHETTPIGKSEDDNIEVEKYGQIRDFSFVPKAHYEITNDLEFKKAAIISKSRFVITKGFIAKLERAIANLMLDTHENSGYLEVGLPVIVNENTLLSSGQLPKFEQDLFKINSTNNEDDEFSEQERDFYLIPTAEVVLANLHQNELINEEDLPLKYVAHTQCFRKEAGSAGRDTRGIIRVHQFGKVELFQYVHPELGYEVLESLVGDAQKVLDLLKLPYRKLSLCTADISDGNSKTYDLEVWFPSQNCYRECSSCSNTDEFQARRTKVRFKDKSGKIVYPHLLNGSGLATGRILAAVMENYQNEDGTISIPDVLKRYMNV